MWVWLATLIAVAVGTNDVYPPESPDAADNTANLVDAQHHRVHNLVLNPEQHSLCELKHIRQIITHAHCVSKEIENHVCVGTCFSYSVPQTDPETPGDELLDYCDSCQASESSWTTLSLDCEEYGSAYQVSKTIQMITNCSCSPCHPSRGQQPITNDVTIHNNDHHVSELIYKMLPDSHKFKEGGVAANAVTNAVTPHREDNSINGDMEFKYTEVSLGDLKKEFNLDPHQETLLQGKVLFKDSASFIDNDEEEEDPRHLNY